MGLQVGLDPARPRAVPGRRGFAAEGGEEGRRDRRRRLRRREFVGVRVRPAGHDGVLREHAGARAHWSRVEVAAEGVEAQGEGQAGGRGRASGGGSAEKRKRRRRRRRKSSASSSSSSSSEEGPPRLGHPPVRPHGFLRVRLLGGGGLRGGGGGQGRLGRGSGAGGPPRRRFGRGRRGRSSRRRRGGLGPASAPGFFRVLRRAAAGGVVGRLPGRDRGRGVEEGRRGSCRGGGGGSAKKPAAATFVRRRARLRSGRRTGCRASCCYRDSFATAATTTSCSPGPWGGLCHRDRPAGERLIPPP